MEFLLLKIPKKELIALHAIKSKLHSGRSTQTQTRTRTYADTKPSTFFIGFIHQSALNVGNQSALNLVKRKHSVLSPWINLFTRHASFVRLVSFALSKTSISRGHLRSLSHDQRSYYFLQYDSKIIQKCNISLTDSKAGGCYPVNDKFFCKQCSMAEINEQMKRTQLH